MAQIEYVTNELMRNCGTHEEVIRLYLQEFLRRFGNHLDSKRIDEVPGLTDEIRRVVKEVADHGVRVEEQGPRWDLQLKMNAKLASSRRNMEQSLSRKSSRMGVTVGLFGSLLWSRSSCWQTSGGLWLQR